MGSRVAFVSNRNDGIARIYVADTNGTNVTPLTVGMGPAWSPDGKQIVFHRFAAMQPPTIFVINADGSDETPLREGDQPAWSPDGTRIAYVSGNDIYMMNNDGSDPKLFITHNFANDNGGCFSPKWSGDGTHIAIACQEYDVSYGTYLVNVAGTPTPVSFYDHAATTNWDKWDLDWSHDSSRIAFSDRNAQVIASLRPDGTDYKMYASSSTASANPSWSPDGHSVAFSQGFWQSSTPVRIYVAKIDGTVTRMIPDLTGVPDYYDSDPAWSP